MITKSRSSYAIRTVALLREGYCEALDNNFCFSSKLAPLNAINMFNFIVSGSTLPPLSTKKNNSPLNQPSNSHKHAVHYLAIMTTVSQPWQTIFLNIWQLIQQNESYHHLTTKIKCLNCKTLNKNGVFIFSVLHITTTRGKNNKYICTSYRVSLITALLFWHGSQFTALLTWKIIERSFNNHYLRNYSHRYLHQRRTKHDAYNKLPDKTMKSSQVV